MKRTQSQPHEEGIPEDSQINQEVTGTEQDATDSKMAETPPPVGNPRKDATTIDRSGTAGFNIKCLQEKKVNQLGMLLGLMTREKADA